MKNENIDEKVSSDKKEEDNELNKKCINKVSPKRKRIEAFGKTINNKDLPNLIRTKFGKSLEKLNSTDTKDVGFNELKQTIALYNNQDYIRIYYSLLSVYNKNFSVSAKELQILLIGYLSSIFRDNLVDISEKPSSLTKTISKFTGIIFNYLSKVFQF
jgi:hypothetical protein